MAVMIERDELESGKSRSGEGTHVRSARRAWVAVALTPVGLALAVALQLSVFHTVSEKSDPTTWEAFSYIAPTSVVMFAAPVAGLLLGLRSAVSRNRSGLVAALVAAAAIAVLSFLAVGFFTPPEM